MSQNVHVKPNKATKIKRNAFVHMIDKSCRFELLHTQVDGFKDV